MRKTDERSEMEERLRFIFGNVNEWLKFAEAKNAVLVAFNGAALFAIIDLFTQDAFKSFPLVIFFLYIFLVCVLSGLIIAIISFFPTMKPKTSTPDNFLFYGSISKHSPETYLSGLYTENDPKASDNFHRLCLDYAHQIITNSQISIRKYKFFRYALFITIIGVFNLVIGLIIYVYSA